MPGPMIFIMNMRIAHGPREEPTACLLSWGSGGQKTEKAGTSRKLELSECAELDFLDPVGANRYH